ncbi:Septum formation topological specificity factor MinE [Beggiatoa sp. PS]|nr:Septum formation topological specificity factor MinE [Beggiatoa sp. PS]
MRDPATVDYLPLLQRELIEVIRKYIVINEENIKVNIEKEGDYEILEVNITLPEANH